MASDDLNLETGDPSGTDAGAARRRRRRERAAEQSPPARSEVPEGEVRHQFMRAFDGIAKARDAKGDTELADAIREEGDAMTEGFVTLTDTIKPARLPVIIGLNIAIVLLAFGRVGGILLYRLQERRARKQAERDEAAGLVEYPNDTGTPVEVH